MDIVILAGGQGTRMKSALPKTMHKIAGKPFLAHLLATANSLKARQVIIIQAKNSQLDLQFANFHQTEQTSSASQNLIWLEQTEPKGTADAVKTALSEIQSPNCLILYGDVPLITTDTLQSLIELHKHKKAALSLITTNLANPTGYGRIIRNSRQAIVGICEEKDADESIKQIKEVNTGLMLVQTEILKRYLNQIQNHSAQKEFYLTDLIELVSANQHVIASIEPHFGFEVTGVNSQTALHQLEREYQTFLAEKLLNENVTLLDKNRIDIRGTLECGLDVVIDVNCIFEGAVTLGNGVQIGANCIIRNSHIHSGTQVLPNCIIDGAVVGPSNSIGPFARVRPATETKANVKIGNFVEIKKSQIDEGSKINHLSYIGDCTMGQNVNVGAGVITCNFDGQFKHQTLIEDDCFIGSGSELIAPIHLAKGTLVGAGSSLTEDTEKDTLNLTRAPLTTKPLKKK